VRFLVPHTKLRSGRSADLRSLRWCGIERLAGVGYLLSANLLMRGLRPMAFAPGLKWKNLVRRGPDFLGGQRTAAGSREANIQETPLPDRPLKSYAKH
jgi:hypothetical protein